MAKYTEQEIKEALANGKKPEGMSSTYWSKLRRGQAGKCYGVAEKVSTPEAPAPAVDGHSEVSDDIPTSDEEFTTTVVEADGTVRIISSSEV